MFHVTWRGWIRTTGAADTRQYSRATDLTSSGGRGFFVEFPQVGITAASIMLPWSRNVLLYFTLKDTVGRRDYGLGKMRPKNWCLRVMSIVHCDEFLGMQVCWRCFPLPLCKWNSVFLKHINFKSQRCMPGIKEKQRSAGGLTPHLTFHSNILWKVSGGGKAPETMGYHCFRR